jgi:hypothetical protein
MAVKHGLLLWGKNINYTWKQMPRKILGPKKNEVSGQFMLLYNELCDLFRSPIIRVVKQGGYNGLSM